MKGLFVTLEGPDTCGKSTQVKLLKVKLELEGFKVNTRHYPDYNKPIGSLIRSVLNGDIKMDKKALQILYAGDQVKDSRNIREYVGKGMVVISDRYDLSTAVYSGATFTNGFNYMYKNVQKGMVRPNITFIFDLPSEEINKRKKDLDGFEKNEKLMDKICKEYKEIDNKITLFEDKREIKHIDATKSVEEIHEIIYRTIRNKLKYQYRN